jgi:hypothetical protein
MWPLQSEMRAFYGDPGRTAANAKWEAANLVTVPLPWVAVASWDNQLKITKLRVHKLVAPSLSRVLEAIWSACGRSQSEIDKIGMNQVGGGYNFRPSRSGTMLSTHAYGAAVDFDPARNGMGDKTPAMDSRVIAAFEKEGWVWGGRWLSPDGMHFQAARVK